MKLHLGCGKRYIEGFFHIDAMPAPHVDHVCAIDNLGFIQSDSVELIYCCHVLEHFKRGEVRRVLTEWFRVLRPGGLLRLSVPDFAQICEIYRQHRDLQLVLGALYGGQSYLYNVHYNAFDFDSMREVTEEAGFTGLVRYDWRDTEHAGVDDYSQAYIPHMDKENGIQLSLNVECRKPV